MTIGNATITRAMLATTFERGIALWTIRTGRPARTVGRCPASGPRPIFLDSSEARSAVDEDVSFVTPVRHRHPSRVVHRGRTGRAEEGRAVDNHSANRGAAAGGAPRAGPAGRGGAGARGGRRRL